MIFFVYLLTTIIFSVVKLSIATATVSFDTMAVGQPNKNHHFNMLALSVATATVCIDNMDIGQPNKKHHFNMFALRVATATVSVDTMIFCVLLYLPLSLSVWQRGDV